LKKHYFDRSAHTLSEILGSGVELWHYFDSSLPEIGAAIDYLVANEFIEKIVKRKRENKGRSKGARFGEVK
jgi:hypothetical protein